MATSLAQSGLAEAVATVAAIVVFGVAAPRGEPVSAPPRTVLVASTTLSSPQTEPPTVAPASAEPASERSQHAAGDDPRVVAALTPDPQASAPAAVEGGEPAPAPMLSVGSDGTDAPMRGQAHSEGTEWSTASYPATADLEGDGEDELTIQPPTVFLDCPKPEERGVITGIACSLVDSASAPS